MEFHLLSVECAIPISGAFAVVYRNLLHFHSMGSNSHQQFRSARGSRYERNLSCYAIEWTVLRLSGERS